MAGRSSARTAGKRGHLNKNCWSKLRNKEKAEKAHVAQSEEDEHALFMVSAICPQFQFQIHGGGGNRR